MTNSNPPVPNIILITTDQQRFDSLSCYGSSFVDTPALDRLAKEGVLFERAYCSNPVCTPSRVSIFTGQYVHRHGVWNTGVYTPETTPFISYRLKQAGYRTHLIGKAHFSPYGHEFSPECQNQETWAKRMGDFQGPYYGFDQVELAQGHTIQGLTGHYGQWVRDELGGEEALEKANTAVPVTEAFGGHGLDWNLPLELHNSVWVANRAISFLQNNADDVVTEDGESKGTRPFFLSLNFQDPHHPHALPIEYSRRVEQDEVPKPIPPRLSLLDSVPPMRLTYDGLINTTENAFRGDRVITGQKQGRTYRDVSESDTLVSRAYYYSMVHLVDDQVGRILSALDELNLAENTIVIFTSDHGELLGDHGLWLKGPFHFESAVRVPLLVRWPARLGSGKRVRSVVSLVDIAPFILDAVGLAAGEDLNGVSFMPLASGALGDGGYRQAERRAVLVECRDDPHKLRLRTVITSRYKLTYYHDYDFGELYDLSEDPREENNLYDDVRYREQKLELLTQLMDLTEDWGPSLPRYGDS